MRRLTLLALLLVPVSARPGTLGVIAHFTTFQPLQGREVGGAQVYYATIDPAPADQVKQACRMAPWHTECTAVGFPEGYRYVWTERACGDQLLRTSVPTRFNFGAARVDVQIVEKIPLPEGCPE